MKSVFKFNYLPVFALVIGGGLAVAMKPSDKLVPTYGQVPTSIDPSGFVNINSLPEGYAGYRCNDSEETCLYNTANASDPSSVQGNFELIPE